MVLVVAVECELNHPSRNAVAGHHCGGESHWFFDLRGILVVVHRRCGCRADLDLLAGHVGLGEAKVAGDHHVKDAVVVQVVVGD